MADQIVGTLDHKLSDFVESRKSNENFSFDFFAGKNRFVFIDIIMRFSGVKNYLKEKQYNFNCNLQISNLGPTRKLRNAGFPPGISEI